jgi:AcrR family transcriptional regulator
MGARAEQQAQTRLRIADAAVDLHQSVGPARTTISAIADRAGVERLTVYRHFPDEPALFAACSGRFLAQHPPPDLGQPMTDPSPMGRLDRVLAVLYPYYRHTEPMLSALTRDAVAVPLVAEYLAPYMTMLNEVSDALAAPFSANRRRVRAAIGHALAFATWRSLALQEGLSDGEAAALMSALVSAVGSAA